MKRLKTVFNNDQLCHVFVAQTQAEGRNSSSTLYFEGNKIWSYGSHYLLGQIISIKGEKVVLRNEYNYSQSTCQHRYSLGNAASHLKVIDLSDPDDYKSSLDNKYAELGAEYFDFFTSNSRGFWSGNGCAERWKCFEKDVAEYNELCEFLSFPSLKINLTPLHKELWGEKYTQLKQRQKELNTPEAIAKRLEDSVKRQEAKDRKEAAEKEKIRIERENALPNWKAGGPFSWYLRDVRPQQIRINGETVETTGGAQVPLAEAIKFLKRVKKGLAKKGDQIGSFEFNSYKKGIVTIGCHQISLAEAESVLGQVNPLRLVQGGAK
jgi:hypothetical protein